MPRSLRIPAALLAGAAAISAAAGGAQDRRGAAPRDPDRSARAGGAAPAVVSPRGDAAAFTRRRAEPAAGAGGRLLQLAGRRIDTRNNAAWPPPDVDGVTLVRLKAETLAEHPIPAPFDTTLGWVRFAPDGSLLSYAVIRDTGVEQWVVDVASGVPRPLTSASLNAAWGEPCVWRRDASGMLCRFLVSARGAPPAEDAARAAYYLTSQLATVRLATGRRRDVGDPAPFVRAAASPNGAFILAEMLELPPPGGGSAGAFGRSAAILDSGGALVRRLAALPPSGAGDAARAGPRGHVWNPDEPAEIVWVEPGAAGGDRVLKLDAPFDADPETLIETGLRVAEIAWTGAGLALVTEPAGDAARQLQ